MLRHARRHSVLLVKGREIDGVSLIQQQGGQQLLLGGRITRQIEITHQPGRVQRCLLVLHAETNFM